MTDNLIKERKFVLWHGTPPLNIHHPLVWGELACGSVGDGGDTLDKAVVVVVINGMPKCDSKRVVAYQQLAVQSRFSCTGRGAAERKRISVVNRSM